VLVEARKMSGGAGWGESYRIKCLFMDNNDKRKGCDVPPGSENSTTRLLANKSAEVMSFHLKGFEPPIASSRTRALKVTAGTRSPSFNAFDAIDRTVFAIEAWTLTDGRALAANMMISNQMKIDKL
jgi:hypothetical protein